MQQTLPPTTTVVATVVNTQTVVIATCAPNSPVQVVRNPDFEAGLAPWTFTRTGGQVGLVLSFCGLDTGPPVDCRLTGSGCRCL